MTLANFQDRRVLVIEDEGLIAIHIQDTLEELGCTVVGPVRGVGEAIDLIDQNAVDAALLDVNLGEGRNSYALAEELDRRGIPLAFLTGYGANGIRADFRDRAVISKPIDRSRLERALRAL